MVKTGYEANSRWLRCSICDRESTAAFLLAARRLLRFKKRKVYIFASFFDIYRPCDRLATFPRYTPPSPSCVRVRL